MSEKTARHSRDWISRRRLLLGAAAGTLGAGAASVAARAAKPAIPEEEPVDLAGRHDFYRRGGQAGIRTPPQRHVFFMTFDLSSPLRSDLQVLLARWSAAIAQMMKGETVGRVEPKRREGIGFDTGEALDLGPASLTVTVGLGPNAFTDAYGLADRRPALLRELHCLPSDALKPELTGGDIFLQACADDPQVAYHAIRDLARIAKETGTASTRWAVLGFGRASAGQGQATPRNLLGFKDGTRNIRDEADFARHVWIKDGPAWQRHGCYQVVRNILMHIENWDTDRIGDQNDVFGRHKASGAPLTGTCEFDEPDLRKRCEAATSSFRPRPISGLRLTRTMTASRSCAAPTTIPTASTGSACSTPACCSFPTRTARRVSKGCR